MEENENKTKEKPSRGKKVWMWILIGVGILVTLSAIIGVSERDNSLVTQTSTDEKLEVTNLQMSVEYVSLFDGWDVTITGLAENTSRKNYSYVSVSFTLYDVNGTNIGSAIANMNNLASGERWSFEAVSFDYPKSKPVSCKLVEINAW